MEGHKQNEKSKRKIEKQHLEGYYTGGPSNPEKLVRLSFRLMHSNRFQNIRDLPPHAIILTKSGTEDCHLIRAARFLKSPGINICLTGLSRGDSCFCSILKFHSGTQGAIRGRTSSINYRTILTSLIQANYLRKTL